MTFTIFQTPYSANDPRNGEACAVIGHHVLNPEETLTVIRFADGVQLEVWPEEIQLKVVE